MPTNYEWLLHMDGEERQAWFDAEHVDNARSAKRAAAVERLNSVEQATDENLLDAILGAPNGMTLYGAEKLVALKALLTDDNGAWRINDGVTNLEWLYEYDEAFAYGAKKFVVDDGYSCCETLDQAHEWLMAPHEDAQSKDQSKDAPVLSDLYGILSDANDDLALESDVTANDVDANDENTTQDSREKLEDKAFNLIARMVNEAYTMGAHEADWSVNRQSVRNCITELFDGVAAITRKTEQAAWIQQANGLIHEANVRADELQDTVESLKAERDYWRTWYLNIEHDNSVLQAKVDELRDELAKRDKGIARLKRQRDEARRELTDSREYLNGWDIGSVVDLLKQYESNKLMRDCDHETLSWIDNEKLHAQVDRLEAERDALAADLRDCERQRERLRQALGCAIDHAHEVVSLVNLDGEVIG